MRLLIALAALVLLQTPALSREFVCEITAINECRSEGCRPRESTAYRKVDPKSGIYARCNWEGCESYDADFHDGGAEWSITLPDALARLSKDGSSLVEVMLLGPIAFASYATCK